MKCRYKYLHRRPERSRWLRDLGRFYMTDERNHIAGWHVTSLEQLAKDVSIILAK